jgi:hypothetical protein
MLGGPVEEEYGVGVGLGGAEEEEEVLRKRAALPMLSFETVRELPLPVRNTCFPGNSLSLLLSLSLSLSQSLSSILPEGLDWTVPEDWP